MAGLTREQRAQREADKALSQQEAEAGLVLMAQGDDEMLVHPSCVNAHIGAGWSVKEQE